MPYIIPIEAAIQIYFNDMDSLTMIFLRRFPLVNINTLEKFFTEAITFTKQANPNGGGMILPAKVVTTIQTYHVGVPKIPC